MTEPSESPESLHRLRVWFGHHVIADWTGPVPEAEEYAAFMARRFPSLRVISDPGTEQVVTL